MDISNKPYLIRAIHEWCLDCEYTPHILAGVGYDGLNVPEEYITDGQIVFNISPSATRDLEIKNEAVTFLANFGQKVVSIQLPMASIMAIYAYENGDGVTFDDDDQVDCAGISTLIDTGLSVIDPENNEGEQKEKTDHKKSEKKSSGRSKARPVLTILK